MKFSAVFFIAMLLVTLLASDADAGKIPVGALRKAGKAIVSIR